MGSALPSDRHAGSRRPVEQFDVASQGRHGGGSADRGRRRHLAGLGDIWSNRLLSCGPLRHTWHGISWTQTTDGCGHGERATRTRDFSATTRVAGPRHQHVRTERLHQQHAVDAFIRNDDSCANDHPTSHVGRADSTRPGDPGRGGAAKAFARPSKGGRRLSRRRAGAA